mgnify:CR=1 FL=1
MADLKTRKAVKGTVKTIDRAAVAAERLKSAAVRTKNAAERSATPAETSSQEYGAQKLERTAQGTVSELDFQFRKRGRRGFSDARRNADKAKAQMQKCRDVLRENKPKKAVQAPHTPKPAKTVRTGARPIQRTGRIVIKPPVGSEAAQVAKAAAKTAPKAVQTVKAAAKAAVQTVRNTARATLSAAKAAIAGAKAVIAAITAGGWAAVAIILVLCVVGLISSSCFGIFFSGEGSGTGQTMRQAVQEINADYQSQIDTARANLTYDELEMSGSRAVWPEVLSVYAVKTTTDPDNAMDVATVDDSRKAILKDIFWQMNEITSRTETNTETVIEESDDGNGNIVETTTTVTRTTLYITVSHKTAEEMADQFDFDADQREQLAELLADENNSLWAAVLYGIGVSDDAIVAVALSQVGNIGGQPYWSWYGFEGRVEWCACFVSWCANECGYIENGIIPKFAGCVNGVQWFKDRGQWADNSIEPTPGMIIFFDWDSPNGSSGPQDGQSDHVGIVEKCENGIVYTVEGNSGDSCRQRQYPVGYYEILGYGIPSY